MLKIDLTTYEVSIKGNTIFKFKHTLPTVTDLTVFGRYCTVGTVINLSDFTKKRVQNISRYSYCYAPYANKRILMPYTRGKKMDTIFIILESPSRSEYNYHFIPNKPANGQTGYLIDTYLENVLEKIFNHQYSVLHKAINDNQKICIRLVNSVRNQTDLYSIFKSSTLTNTLKKKLWSEMFYYQKERLFLRKEIKKYKPIIIINASTSLVLNAQQGTIQECVGYELNNLKLQGLKFDEYRTYHPSMWNSNNTINNFNKNLNGYYEW